MDLTNLLIKDKIRKEIEIHGLVRIVEAIDYLKKKEVNIYKNLIEVYEDMIKEILKENPNLH